MSKRKYGRDHWIARSKRVKKKREEERAAYAKKRRAASRRSSYSYSSSGPDYLPYALLGVAIGISLL